jgi:hypothetical protein
MAGRILVTRAEYLDSIRQLSAVADDLVSRFDMNQLTWQPAAGERWSILECLDHLAISTGIYLDAMGLVIGDARTGGAETGVFHDAGYPSSRFIHAMEPPPRTRFRAPGKIRPRPTLSPEGIPPQFRKTMDRVAAMVASSSGRDLNSVRFRNPFVPLVRFTVAAGFLIVAAHGRRHLWQAEQVSKESDFPAARS